jgi:hypothetical protein
MQRQFTLNGKPFRVQFEPARAARFGRINVKTRLVQVHTHDKFGSPLDDSIQQETFIHELTHAVLHEMDHPQWDDEKFVGRFATLMHEAFRTFQSDPT